MAKLRKASCYKRLETPYTRRSKKRAKSYVRANPHSKIVSFDMGNKQEASNFPVKIQLISKEGYQIRHNALESARVAVNKILTKKIGVTNYHFKIRAYPHHMLRENPLAAGAGADRMSTGMAHSFGKIIGIAAQIRKGQPILEVATTEKYIDAAKEAVQQGNYKFAGKGRIIIIK